MTMTETLVSLQRSFNRALRVEGRSERTIVIYGQAIDFFGRWVRKTHGHEAAAEDLTKENLLDWLDSLRARGQSDGTVLARWRGIRRFVGWLIAEDIIDWDPLAGISVKKPEATPVPVLTDDELKALVAACKGKEFRDRRDEAFIRLLIDCGIRASELTGIMLDDLDLDGESLVVTGKGSRVRVVYFGSKTALALDRYLRVRARQRHADLPNLLIGERGPLSPDGVSDRLEVRGRQAGIAGKVNPHRFRHTAAHDFLLAGGQERDLKRLMGWRSDAMLERYGASAADHRAREAARRLNRGNRI